MLHSVFREFIYIYDDGGGVNFTGKEDISSEMFRKGYTFIGHFFFSILITSFEEISDSEV